MYKPVIIEIVENRQLYIDNKEVFKSRTDLSDEQFLIQLLYVRYIESIKLLDLEKEQMYGVQFFRYDRNDKFINTKQWNSLYQIHIFSDLGHEDLKYIFKAIGYKLILTKRNYYFSVTTYELRPLKRKLKKGSQYKLFP